MPRRIDNRTPLLPIDLNPCLPGSPWGRRQRGEFRGALVIAACLICVPVLAQDAVGQGAQAQPPTGELRVEWAIAPEGTSLPSGTVVQEGIFLPPGTVLPGGAILPGASAVEPIPEPIPAPTPMPTGEPIPAPMTMPEPASPAGAAPALSSEPTLTPIPDPIPEPTPAPALSGQSPLQPVTQGVPHLSGGIGSSEREQMEQVKGQYNLRLLFAAAGSGAYLSHVRVTIQDAAGPTLPSTVTVGPWFYATLAPGDYTLTVEYTGQAQTRQVRVPASGAAAESFYWSIQ